MSGALISGATFTANQGSSFTYAVPYALKCKTAHLIGGSFLCTNAQDYTFLTAWYFQAPSIYLKSEAENQLEKIWLESPTFIVKLSLLRSMLQTSTGPLNCIER